MKLKSLIEEKGIEIRVYADKEQQAYITEEREGLHSLLSPAMAIEKEFLHELNKPVRLFLSGTAGEGVQSAAEMFIRAGMRCGLHVTKKGSYPVTVGVGFSAAHLILSPDTINYTGAPRPDVVLVMSEDGLKFAKKQIDNMDEDAMLIIDSTLEVPETKARVVAHHFREHVGGRNAMIMAMFEYLRQSNIIPKEALNKQFMGSRIAANEKLLRQLQEEFGLSVDG